MKPFAFVDFEREAEALLAQAREKAAAILGQALAESENVKERARIEGAEAGRREALDRDAALVGEVVRRIEARREDLCAEAGRDLLRLAVAIAERIVRAEIGRGRPVAEAGVRRAIELSSRRHDLSIRVHPADFERLAGLRARLSEIRFDADASLAEGGAVAECAEGRVDLEIRTQLDRIERELLE